MLVNINHIQLQHKICRNWVSAVIPISVEIGITAAMQFSFQLVLSLAKYYV